MSEPALIKPAYRKEYGCERCKFVATVTIEGTVYDVYFCDDIGPDIRLVDESGYASNDAMYRVTKGVPPADHKFFQPYMAALMGGFIKWADTEKHS